MFQVLFCGTGWHDIVPTVQRALDARKIPARVIARDPSRPLTEQIATADVALPSNAEFTRDVIERATKLRLIQQPAVGHERVDIETARSRGIPVCNVPAANTDSVAQATLLLILALARRWRVAQRRFAEARIGEPLGHELNGRSLAIVGMGRTGTAVAQLARAFGMHVVGAGRRDGRDGLLALVGRVDIVSLHCPLNAATQGLFDDAMFASMRKGATLVNVARGGIVDRSALERALASGRLGALGLDVFWDEPWDPADPLFARDDVVVLPHVAGSTSESFERVAARVADNIGRLARGQALHDRVDGVTTV